MPEFNYRKFNLVDQELMLAPLTLRDKQEWLNLRARNRDWLARWEASRPFLPPELGPNESLPSYREMISTNLEEGKALRNIALGIWMIAPHKSISSDHFSPGAKGRANSKRELIGQITLGGIVFGALRGAHIGYWIDQNHSNFGYMTRSVRLLSQFAFDYLGLHRIEINCRPENEASAKVAIKAGYSFEGERHKFLHIDGDWRDHRVYVAFNEKIH